ncbi:MAG: FAD-binding domain-containing protein [Opitutales bacterium]
MSDPQAASPFLPHTREEARQRLDAFLPNAGRAYATGRNTDPGPGARDHVSLLSPFLRHRLIGEDEVIRSVLGAHAASTADKFIQEVIWRTYWKGWLALRPAAWSDWLAERDRDRAAVADNAGKAHALRQAEAGETGIACFDAWARELVETGYLHNHARMWFASIWIFTLNLPWSLGAAFFLRHLLDGDPASNTLSWRWVAGLQTRGKAYVARAGNIAKFTDGRFNPKGQLNEAPEPLDWRGKPDIQDLAPLPDQPDPALFTDGPVGVLLTGDDLSLETLWPDIRPDSVAGGWAPEISDQHGISPPVQRWVTNAIADARNRAADAWQCPAVPLEVLWRDGVGTWAFTRRLKHVLVMEPQVGSWHDALAPVARRLQSLGVQLHRFRRAWDTDLFPHATAGFFKFKKQQGSIVEALKR